MLAQRLRTPSAVVAQELLNTTTELRTTELTTKPGAAASQRKTDDQIPLSLQAIWDSAPQNARDRSSRKQCLAVWRTQKLELRAEAVREGLEKWKLSEKWIEDEGKYVEGLHRWLAKEKWQETPQPYTEKHHGTAGIKHRGLQEHLTL